jgi:phage tail-like protein
MAPLKLTVDFIYNLFPEKVRNEDAQIDTHDESKNKPLYRFLGVIVDGGLSIMEQDIVNFTNLFDPDKCSDKYLPLLASLLGFEFPFDLSPKVQRRFIKYIPAFSRKKGTKNATEFIIKELLNFDVEITSEDAVSRTFEISFTAPEDDSEATNLENKATTLLNTYKVANSNYTKLITYYSSDIWRSNMPIEEYIEYEADAGNVDSSSLAPVINFTELMTELTMNDSGTFDLEPRGINIDGKFMLNTIEGSILNNASGFIEDWYDIIKR